MAKRLSYSVILEKEIDPEFKGYYNASVPALPGCLSYGSTKQEALKNIKEAIALYLEDLKLHNEPIPEDTPPSIEKVGVAI
jgi:predicted RNase H-like HicB family nuclease